MTVAERQSKYCDAISDELRTLGHASNNQLLALMRSSFPELSATTVHRATARMAERGHIGIAPKSLHGELQYDANPVPHDHFMCQICGTLRDTDIAQGVKRLVEDSLEGCSISGRVVVSGICAACKEDS